MIWTVILLSVPAVVSTLEPTIASILCSPVVVLVVAIIPVATTVVVTYWVLIPHIHTIICHKMDGQLRHCLTSVQKLWQFMCRFSESKNDMNAFPNPSRDGSSIGRSPETKGIFVCILRWAVIVPAVPTLRNYPFIRDYVFTNSDLLTTSYKSVSISTTHTTHNLYYHSFPLNVWLLLFLFFICEKSLSFLRSCVINVWIINRNQ